MKGSFSISRGLILGVLTAYLAWVVFPMLWVAYSSLKPDEAIFRDAFALPVPGEFAWDNYRRAWEGARFSTYFVNSLWVTGTSVFGILLLGSMAAYALSRFTHPIGTAAYALFLAGLMIPVQLSIVPLFFQLRSMGLLNTRTGLILVYIANGLPFAVFILGNFFRALPRSLYEAAVVDGCSDSAAFWKVMLPLARPGLVTVAIFQFIGIWKEDFFAFMFTTGSQSDAVRTLPLGLANLSLVAQYRNENGMLFAGVVIVTLPILLVYLFLQKHLVKGVTAGALKG